MATKPSYKNIVTAPVTKIFSIPSGEFIPTTFIQRCIERAIREDTYNVPDGEWQLIIEIEEEEIQALQNPKSSSYGKMKQTLVAAAKEADVNIVIYMGHMEVCSTHVRKLDFNTFNYRNGKPTCVFLIACHSEEYVKELNERAVAMEIPLYFFGFHTLMHAIDGGIFMCKETHKEMPNLDCVYPESYDNAAILFRNETNESTMKEILRTELQKPFEEQAEILKCCKSKYERFRKIFYENINKRDCAKFTAADMAKKCQTIRNPEFMTKELYVVHYEDGTACTKEEPCPVPLASLEPYARVAKTFNDRIRAKLAVQEIREILQPEHNVYASHSRVEKEKRDLRIVQILTPLTPEERKDVLQTQIQALDFQMDVPIFFLLFFEKYSFSVKDILQRKEISLRLTSGSSQLGFLHMITYHFIKNFARFQIYTEKELFRLFQEIYKMDPEVFWVQDYSFDTPLSILFKAKDVHTGLLGFFFTNFKDKQHYEDNSEALLTSVLKNPFWDSADKLTILEQLFAYGVKQFHIDTVPYYEYSEKGNLSPQILHLLYDKGFNTSRQPGYEIRTRIKFFSDCLLPNSTALVKYKKGLSNSISSMEYSLMPSRRRTYLRNNNYNTYSNDEDEEDGFRRLIADYGKYVDYERIALYKNRIRNLPDFVRNAYTAYNSVSSLIINDTHYELNREAMQAAISAAMAPYVEGEKAIRNIKAYFGTLQKQIKKRAISQAEKEKLFTELKTIYNSRNPGENEGNAALRRMNDMRTKVEEFERGLRAANAGGRRSTIRRRKLRNRKTRKQ